MEPQQVQQSLRGERQGHKQPTGASIDTMTRQQHERRFLENRKYDMLAAPTSNTCSPGRSASVSFAQWRRDDWWTWDRDSVDPLDASATTASSTMAVDEVIMEELPWGAQWATWNADRERFPEDSRWERRY